MEEYPEQTVRDMQVAAEILQSLTQYRDVHVTPVSVVSPRGLWLTIKHRLPRGLWAIVEGAVFDARSQADIVKATVKELLSERTKSAITNETSIQPLRNRVQSVRMLLAWNLDEELGRDTANKLNGTGLFQAGLDGSIGPSGLPKSGYFDVDEAADFLINLRRKECIVLVLASAPVLDKRGQSMFGLAVEGNGEVLGASMVSTNRLLGLQSDVENRSSLSSERLAKESLHELGHAMGLKHCPVSFCAMRISFEPSEVDARFLRFCSDCLQGLEGNLRKRSR